MEARRRPIERRRDAARGAAHRADGVDGRRRRARGLQRWFAERGGVGFGIGRGTADRGIAARDGGTSLAIRRRLRQGRFDDGADDGAGGERERVRAERDADRRIRRGDGAGGGRGDAIFVPAPRAAEEGDKDERERLMEPLALMQQPATGDREEEPVTTDDVVTGADVASAGAIESTEDATETPSAGVDANAFGDETPAEFGGGDAGAPEMGVYDDWATTETSGGGDAVDGGRWDASRVDPMTTETESRRRRCSRRLGRARRDGDDVHRGSRRHADARRSAPVDGGTTVGRIRGPRGLRVRPRWKYDDGRRVVLGRRRRRRLDREIRARRRGC